MMCDMVRRTSDETADRVPSVSGQPQALCLSVAGPGLSTFVVALPAQGRVSVGRDPSADLCVQSPALSRLHFALELGGEVAQVVDLGSRHGTVVDGAPLAEHGVTVRAGAEIVAGDVRFSLLRQGSLPAGTAMPLSPAREPEERTSTADVPAAFRYPSLAKLHEELRRVARRPISVLITGETGAGKEVVARELHRLSGRKGPLVAVNTAALPENLIESELFGHDRGAFSGAQVARAGLIETSDGGTLFLDEIGELPLPLQAKLLRVLEDQSVRRVGANTERKLDLRVVAATHQDLGSAVREKRFRQDLLFRLNAVTLALPPLRSRKGEIGQLARHLLAELSDPPPLLDPGAAEALERYHWPGNVRELKHVLERALAFRDAGPILREHLPALLSDGASHAEEAHPGDVRSTVKDFERARILDALKEAGGNRTRAAEILGLPRRTLVYKLSKMRLDDER